MVRSVRFTNDIEERLAAVGSGSGGKGGKGSMEMGKGERVTKLDKKEIMVGKIPDCVSKLAFRQWLKSVVLQFETTYE